MEVRSQEDYNTALRLVGEIDYGFWLGGSEIEQEGVWAWDSNGEQIENSFWSIGEPSCEEEDCLEIHGGFFNDLPCGVIRPYVCVLE